MLQMSLMCTRLKHYRWFPQKLSMVILEMGLDMNRLWVPIFHHVLARALLFTLTARLPPGWRRFFYRSRREWGGRGREVKGHGRGREREWEGIQGKVRLGQSLHTSPLQIEADPSSKGTAACYLAFVNQLALVNWFPTKVEEINANILQPVRLIS